MATYIQRGRLFAIRVDVPIRPFTDEMKRWTTMLRCYGYGNRKDDDVEDGNGIGNAVAGSGRQDQIQELRIKIRNTASNWHRVNVTYLPTYLQSMFLLSMFLLMNQFLTLSD